MPLPSTIAEYEAEWALVAEALTRQNTLTLPCGDAKQAQKLRFRFYGFRRALKKHDATNPWIAALMETQATITPEGHLHFERSPFAATLRGLMEHSVIKGGQMPGTFQGGAEQAKVAQSVDPITTEASDQTILEFLTKKLSQT